jgi:hypothetical protein
MNISRAFRVIAVGLATVFLTTGCIKVDMAMTIAKDDTVSGEFVFAVAKSLSEMSEESGDNATSTDGLLSGAENVKTEVYDDGQFVGTKYVFEGVPLEQFKPKFDDDASALSIVRDGDNIVVSGALDASTPDAELEENPFGSAILESFAASTSIKIAIDFPGEIKETSGKASGQKVTWIGAFGKKLDITALVYSPLTPPIDWILIGSLAGGALLLVGLFLILWTRKRQKDSRVVPQKSATSKKKPIPAPLEKLTLTEAMLTRPWYQQKRYAIPLIVVLLTALVYWVGFTN